METPTKSSRPGSQFNDIKEPGKASNAVGIQNTPVKSPNSTGNVFLHTKSSTNPSNDSSEGTSTVTFSENVSGEDKVRPTPQNSIATALLVHGEDEEDFWANHHRLEEKEKASPSNCNSDDKDKHHSVMAAHVKMSMNMMDVIEDHKVISALGQELILSMLSRQASHQTHKRGSSEKRKH